MKNLIGRATIAALELAGGAVIGIIIATIILGRC